jgi:hypothetical protein
VSRGNIDEVESAAVAYLRRNPRVVVDAIDKDGRSFPGLRAEVESELTKAGKLVVVANQDERERLQQIIEDSLRSDAADPMLA